MAHPAWNKGLTKDDPRVADAEAKRRAVREYASQGGRQAALQRYEARLRERDPLGLLTRERRARYLARRAGIYTESIDYRLVLTRDAWVCGICEEVVAPDDLSFDHIVPFRDGGEHVMENVRVAHAACNSRKGELESREARLRVVRKRGVSSL